MCLSIITKKYPKKDKTEGYGYKIVTKNWPYRLKSKSQNGYIGPLFHTILPLNKWIRRKIAIICIDGILSYESGFHIFKTKKEARKHWIYTGNPNRKIVKVKYKGIICNGIESFLNDNCSFQKTEVLVVKQIFIEK